MADPKEPFDKDTLTHLDASVRDLSYTLDTIVFRALKNALPPIKGMGLASQQVAVAVRDSIRVQSKLAKVLASTGHNLATHAGALNQVGATFEQAGEAVSDAFLAGVRRSGKDTIKLLAQSKALDLDTKALAATMTFNRRTLGVSSDRSVQLAKTFVEVGAQFGITGDAIVRSMNALRPALESAAASFGTGTAVAIQEAATTMVGTFGLGAQKSLESVMGKLMGGTAESTKLAMRLGVPLELLASNLSGDIVKATEIALSRVTELTSGFKGTPGAGLIKGALSKSLGINDAFINLGMMLNDPLQKMNELQIQQLTAQRLQNDFSQAMEAIVTPMKVEVLKMLNSFTKFIDVFKGFMAAILAYTSKALLIWGSIKLIQIAIKAATNSSARFTKAAAMKPQSSILGPAGTPLTGPAVGRGGALMAMMGGPAGIGIAAASIFGPMLWSFFSGKSEEEKRRHQEAQEERKRTADALTKSSPHLMELKSLSADMRRVAITWELYQDSQSTIGNKSNEFLEKIHDASITPGKEDLLIPIRPSNQGVMK